MSRILTAAAVVLCLACGVAADTASSATGNAHSEPQNQSVKEHFDMTRDFARTLATITGTAVNPLLVTAAIGSYKYYTTPPGNRDQLPWFYSPWFWITCAVLVALAFIVSLPSVTANLPPTVSAFVELCNKHIGLIVTTPIVINAITSYYNSIANDPHTAFAFANGTGTIARASVVPVEWLLSLPQAVWYAAVIPMLLFAFFAMWLFNIVFDFLILLSPFGWFDLLLKAARAVFFILLLTASLLFPQLIFIIVLPLMAVSVIMLRWSIRHIIRGIRFIKGLFSGKKKMAVSQ